jgi:hypothetical protein
VSTDARLGARLHELDDDGRQLPLQRRALRLKERGNEGGIPIELDAAAIPGPLMVNFSVAAFEKASPGTAMIASRQRVLERVVLIANSCGGSTPQDYPIRSTAHGGRP